jgi:hypothetical protein
LDLKLVRLLREAIRNADLAGGKIGPLGTVLAPQPCPHPRHRVHPTPRFEPRPVIHPTPRFEPRPVIHPSPRLEPQPPCAPPEPQRCHRPATLPPPWRTPVWKTAVPPAIQVKLHVHRTDVQNKGSLIDLFL